MKISLKRKLIFSFIVVILSSTIISGIISNYFINKKFNDYLISEQDTKIQNIISILQDSIKVSNNIRYFNKDEITRYAENQELYIEIKDLDKNTIYSSGNSHFSRRDNMRRMMNSMGRNSSMMMDAKKYIEKEYPLKYNNSVIGYTTIGYYSTSYFSLASINFLSTLNNSLIISALIALLLGLVVSIIISKELSKPLVNITAATNKMRQGNLEIRLEEKGNTREISDLSKSVNYLADTLKNQEMLRKRLTSDMAHELRTPLTTLKTHVEAFMDGVWEVNSDRLQIFYEEIERLNSMVDDLYKLSKLEELNVNLNLSKLDISQELRKIVETYTPIYEKDGHLLLADIEDNIEILVDKDKFKQIIYNLLSNALKYLNPHGKVELSLHREDENLSITIKDNGIGISKEDLPFIFERFFRSDVSRNKSTGGSGIGLTITKSFVEAHGGKISVSSLLGEGTSFKIILPIRN